jgi:chitin disaccharide deacetylase
MGCTRLDQAVTEMTKRLAKEYDLAFETDGLNVQGISYNGPHKTLEEKVESFKKMLASLESGKTYLFVDHPGIDSPELKAVSHIGYEDVATDRQGVTSLWTSDEIKSLIKDKKIQLISYKDLVKK